MSINIGNALRGLGICALAGALTTILNTMAPLFYGAEGFDAQVALIHHPIYAARQWVLLIHPYVTLLLALGLLLALFNQAPGRASSAFIFAFAEKMTEFLLGVLILFVVNGIWKVAYLEENGPVSPSDLKVRIEIFYELLDGLFFLLWVMYILSTGLFASCMNWADRLERAVMIGAGLTILLTIFMILGKYANQSSWTTPFIKYAYGPILTTYRLLVGIWLIRAGRRSMAKSRQKG